jgi:hypothetical protein
MIKGVLWRKRKSGEAEILNKYSFKFRIIFRNEELLIFLTVNIFLN